MTNGARGLDAADVTRRRAQYGPNTLPARPPRGPAAILATQFKDVMVVMLLVAAGITAVVGDPVDVGAITLIVVVNAILGAAQEWRAERTLASLRSIAAPTARVRRDGVLETVPAVDLVPGDMVLLEAGNLVPADLQLTEVADFEVSEALLTGEAEPVHKTIAPLADEVAGDEGSDMAYQGTLATRGRAVGIVTNTGTRTRLGKIAVLLRDESGVQTPLQQRLTRFGQRLAVAAVVLCGAVFALGLLHGERIGVMLLTAVSLAVAAVPESLPAVVTVALALGARRLARQHALIRRLPAVETLGSVTFICTDKTGTLTENRMRVEAVSDGLDLAHASAGPTSAPPAELFDALALSNDVSVGPNGELTGDPMEIALYQFAASAGHRKAELEAKAPRVAEIAFSPERARTTTIHRLGASGDATLVLTKGAPERVIPCCDRVFVAGASIPLDGARVISHAEQMARSGLRVLAIATKRMTAVPADLADAERGQTFVGLVGLLDPPRAEVKDAVALCQRAGIRVVMITGDHAATALSIATRLGIATDEGSVITGTELRALSSSELDERVDMLRVYARVAPEDKIRIVKALQARGEFVAMTGDGVNDAPALRRANIGIAMGRGGTDIARDASAMVLLDDNFSTIVSAVKEGRRVYDNIRKFLRYVLAGNVGEIAAVVLASLFGFPIPLLPVQILWINLVTDGLPGLALTAEPAERNVMSRPPLPPAESLFARGLWQHVLWVGGLIGVMTFAVQIAALRANDDHWRTMTFTLLTFAQMAYAFASRSPNDSIFTQGFWSNRALVGAVGLTVGLQVATLYVPLLQPLLHTAPLSVAEFGMVVAGSSVVLAAVETDKWFRRRRRATPL